jgi:hypothetical protein
MCPVRLLSCRRRRLAQRQRQSCCRRRPEKRRLWQSQAIRCYWRRLFDERFAHDLGFASVWNGMSAFGDLLTEIISAPLAESGLGIAASDLAQTIVFAIKGFKEA